MTTYYLKNSLGKYYIINENRDGISLSDTGSGVETPEKLTESESKERDNTNRVSENMDGYRFKGDGAAIINGIFLTQGVSADCQLVIDNHPLPLDFSTFIFYGEKREANILLL